MPKFLLHVNYAGDGVRGLLKEGGSSRRDAAARATESVGGTLESFYYAFGDTDAFVIADVPDNETMAALSLAIGSSGAVTFRSTLLISPEEMDKAVKMTPGYRPPGE